MSEDEPLFREEAVDYHLRHSGPGEPVRLPRRALVWSTWLLLILSVAAVVAAFLIRVTPPEGGDGDVGRSLFEVVVSGLSEEAQ